MTIGSLSNSKLLNLLTLYMMVFFCGVSGAYAQQPNEYINQEAVSYTLTVNELDTILQQVEPLPLPEVIMPEGILADPVLETLSPDAQPSYAPGWSGSGPKPDSTITYTITQGTPVDRAASIVDYQVFGTAPTNPLSGPYAPFQRWTHYQNYVKQATATIGKLFFDINNDQVVDASCTASVIGQRVIATAAHCVHSGGSGGSFYGSFIFCPSWYKGAGSGAQHPDRGCWGVSAGTVSSAWVTTPFGASDRDYACLITNPTGNIVADDVGNATGWTGRIYNLSSEQPMVSWGYPAATPFRGYHIILATSPEWYEVNMTSGDGQVSKYIGNDMTGGSSGGPWWLSVSHWGADTEVIDTDNSGATDGPGSTGLPGGPFINGVNSHKRCRVSCFTPPTATAGTFWQEMGSPQFKDTVPDTDEAEDIFKNCFDNDGV